MDEAILQIVDIVCDAVKADSHDIVAVETYHRYVVEIILKLHAQGAERCVEYLCARVESLER
jgi:hypothetical protein